MKLLVTGHNGFIGTILSKELLDHNHEIIGFDREQGDLREPGLFRSYLEEARPDGVIHLAAQVGREFGERSLEFTIENNAIVTSFVANACGVENIPLCYVSTSEIYGDQGDIICDEYLGPFSVPHNLYGLTKRWGEEVAELYAPKDLIIIRPSMPYGPGVVPGKGKAALPNMLWQAHNNLKIPVHKGAERSWIWVGDLVRAFRMILECHWGNSPQLDWDYTPYTYNVGRDDAAISMLEVAQKACIIARAPFDLIEEIDAPKNQTIVKRLSTARLWDLGWEPEVEIDEGMSRVYEWVKQFDATGCRTEHSYSDPLWPRESPRESLTEVQGTDPS